jgi:AraC-like DNA-binding protein
MNAKVEQRVIIKFLSNEGADATEIHHRLFRAFQEDAYTLSSVYQWIRALKTGRTIVSDMHQAGRSQLDHIHSKILSLFPESESQSVRSLAQQLNVSSSTVHARLTDVLGFSLRHTRWGVHLLTEELKTTRIATSMKMLEILEKQKRIHFAGIITGDESWFFLEDSRNRVWRLGRENAPERTSYTFDTDKHMPTIFWPATRPLVESWFQRMHRAIAHTSARSFSHA